MMLDGEAISILLTWASMVIVLPGFIFHQLLVKRLDKKSAKISAWVFFAGAELLFHFLVIRALVRGWTI